MLQSYLCQDHSYDLQQKCPSIGKEDNFSNLDYSINQDHKAQLWNYSEINTDYGTKIRSTAKQTNVAVSTMALGDKVQTHKIWGFYIFFSSTVFTLLSYSKIFIGDKTCFAKLNLNTSIFKMKQGFLGFAES